MTILQRYGDEKLSDNSNIKLCEQCKACTQWGNGNDPFSNKYDKTSCDVFKYPSSKPIGVMDNKEECKYKVTK